MIVLVTWVCPACPAVEALILDDAVLACCVTPGDPAASGCECGAEGTCEHQAAALAAAAAEARP